MWVRVPPGLIMDIEYWDNGNKSGTGDFTHRDIELMSVGNAFVRKRFRNTTINPRIKNVHYYSIGGDEIGIGETMKHFSRYFEPKGKYRVFTDEELDKHRNMSYNARSWWEKMEALKGHSTCFAKY